MNADLDRSYSLDINPMNSRQPWLLRCYGPGSGVTATGLPNSFADHDDAERAGRTWIATGVTPANQRD